MVPLSFFFSRSAGVMHTGLACVRLSGCQRVVEPPPCPSYIPSDRCLQSFETYRRLNATPRPPLHGCTQPTDPPLFALTPSRATRSPQRAAKYKSGQAVFKTIHRFHPRRLFQVDVRRPSPPFLLHTSIGIAGFHLDDVRV